MLHKWSSTKIQFQCNTQELIAVASFPIQFDMMQNQIVRAAQAVARTLGAGHSERMYQKALAMELQKCKGASHTMEYHVPILYEQMNIGGERADIMVHDDQKRAYLIELKATDASIWRGQKPPAHGDAMPPAHVQILKYVRMLQTCDPVCQGYVINFRQRVMYAHDVLAIPCELEIDCFDVGTRAWRFGMLSAIADAPIVDIT